MKHSFYRQFWLILTLLMTSLENYWCHSNVYVDFENPEKFPDDYVVFNVFGTMIFLNQPQSLGWSWSCLSTLSYVRLNVV